MIDTLRDIYAVVWVDLRFLSRNLGKTMALTLVAPILYLLAFGYGLGRGSTSKALVIFNLLFQESWRLLR